MMSILSRLCASASIMILSASSCVAEAPEAGLHLNVFDCFFPVPKGYSMIPFSGADQISFDAYDGALRSSSVTVMDSRIVPSKAKLIHTADKLKVYQYEHVFPKGKSNSITVTDDVQTVILIGEVADYWKYAVEQCLISAY